MSRLQLVSYVQVDRVPLSSVCDIVDWLFNKKKEEEKEEENNNNNSKKLLYIRENSNVLILNFLTCHTPPYPLPTDSSRHVIDYNMPTDGQLVHSATRLSWYTKPSRCEHTQITPDTNT